MKRGSSGSTRERESCRMRRIVTAWNYLILAGSSAAVLGASPDIRVIGWGDNLSWQATGMPSMTLPEQHPFSTGMVAIAGMPLTNVLQLAAGSGHSLALKADGTVLAWGSNPEGYAQGFRTAYGCNTNGLVRIGGSCLSNVVAIATGRDHGLALRADGTVVGWGENRSGQTSAPAGLSNVVAIAAGGEHSMALKRDGTIVAWGDVIQPPTGLSNVVAISTSGHYSGIESGVGLALKSDGTVVAWNQYNPGQAMLKRPTLIHYEAEPVPTPKSLTNIVAIAAGWQHCLALRSDGTVIGWGVNTEGQATGSPKAGAFDEWGLVTLQGQILSNVVTIDASWGSMALKKGGTVVTWGPSGEMFPPPVVPVPEGLTNVVAISMGNGYCLALTTNANGLVSPKGR